MINSKIITENHPA